MEDSQVKEEVGAEQPVAQAEAVSGETDAGSPDVQTGLTEEDVAFAVWALQLGGYLRSLLESDPSAAAQELEAAAQHLRQLATPAEQEKASSAGGEAPGSVSPSQSTSASEGLNAEALERMIQAYVDRALAEKMKQVLASPRSLHGAPVSSRRLADLIE